eukprot:TRINITY_DN577_c0_g1_i1.p1 TRINITY_DN577_c0_g1~~TRINITY_DN577_c0_g1_i1.p1  ORF type:complete len:403 (+),score=80.04 TRINITY_DN577_c0_g1_i1:111-1211(+)
MSCMRHLFDFRAREFATFLQTRATAASRPRVKPDPSQPLAFSWSLPAAPPPPPPALPLPPLPPLPQLAPAAYAAVSMPLLSTVAVSALRAPSPRMAPFACALPSRTAARVDMAAPRLSPPRAKEYSVVGDGEHVPPFEKYCDAAPSVRKRRRDSDEHEAAAHDKLRSVKRSRLFASPTAVCNVLNRVNAGTRSGSETEDGGDAINSTPGYECDQCSAKFCRKHHRDRHVQNIHEGRRPWTCEQCGFAFHQKPNLERHIMTVHEEQKPFRCNVCGVSFGRKGVLKKHVQTVHEQSRKFECDKCSLHFGLKSDLKRHVLSVHQKQRPFVCETCSASFGRKSDLKRHTLSLHPGVAPPSGKRTTSSRRR